MNDIQKAIDEGKLPYGEPPQSYRSDERNYLYTTSQLKSLLEQVAREQRKDEWRGSDFPPSDSKPLVTDNLTFNED